jgi:hypothetical protein
LSKAAPGAPTDTDEAAATPSVGPFCPKCRDVITPSTVGNTTQAKKKFAAGQDCDCLECVKNYKSLTRRWKLQKRLQIWFTSLSEDEKTAWYKKQKEKSEKLTSAEKRAERLRLNITTKTSKRKGKRVAKRFANPGMHPQTT